MTLVESLICAMVGMAALSGSPPGTVSDPFADGSGRTGPLLVLIPALETEIGATPEDPDYVGDELLHRVSLSPYAIGAFEVTVAELCRFLNAAGNQVERESAWVDLEVAGIRDTAAGFAPEPGLERRAAAGITWDGARAYCRWLSDSTGKAYELPTAAQWEAAARAGTRTRWPWGDDDDPRRYHSAAAGNQSAANAGSYPPNAWGLHDTAGNVWEWVLDCHEHDFAAFAPVRDPVLRDDACRTPEMRGGSFREGGRFTRTAFRARGWWSLKLDKIGFRVARRVDAGEGPR